MMNEIFRMKINFNIKISVIFIVILGIINLSKDKLYVNKFSLYL